MPITWPPATHDDVSAQAYGAGGGDYFRTGYYYLGCPYAGWLDSGWKTAGLMEVRPFWVPVRRAFDRMGIFVNSASAGSSYRMGIYNSNGGRAGSLLLDAGTVDTTTTGAKAATISVTLDPGVYFIAAVSQGGAPTVTRFPNPTPQPFFSNVTSPDSSAFGFMEQMSGITGALPSSFTSSGSGHSAPAVSMRAA